MNVNHIDINNINQVKLDIYADPEKNGQLEDVERMLVEAEQKQSTLAGANKRKRNLTKEAAEAQHDTEPYVPAPPEPKKRKSSELTDKTLDFNVW